MSRIEYFALNYLRGSDPEREEMNEWWEHDPRLLDAYMAGARRLAEELEASGAPCAQFAQDLLDEELSPDDMSFVIDPFDAEDGSAPGLAMQIQGGVPEQLSRVPFPQEYQERIRKLLGRHLHAGALSIAFRMLQEVHAATPEFVLTIGPLLAKHLLQSASLADGLRITLREVIEFADQAIADGLVPIGFRVGPAKRQDPEELSLERIADNQALSDLLKLMDSLLDDLPDHDAQQDTADPVQPWLFADLEDEGEDHHRDGDGHGGQTHYDPDVPF